MEKAMTLTPEARGTFAALKQRGRIKHFTPDCAEALVAAGLARLEQNALTLTKKGAALPAYVTDAQAKGPAGNHA
jgi:hypothetical protein